MSMLPKIQEFRYSQCSEHIDLEFLLLFAPDSSTEIEISFAFHRFYKL